MEIDSAAQPTFADVAAWQRALDRHSELLAGVKPGSRIGIVPRALTGNLPDAAAAAQMIVWQMSGQTFAPHVEQFAGMSSPHVDLLFAPDMAAVAAVLSSMESDLLTAMKRQIRRGGMLVFVFKTKRELQDAGYEDFLDSFGLAFLGACR